MDRAPTVSDHRQSHCVLTTISREAHQNHTSPNPIIQRCTPPGRNHPLFAHITPYSSARRALDYAISCSLETSSIQFIQELNSPRTMTISQSALASYHLQGQKNNDIGVLLARLSLPDDSAVPSRQNDSSLQHTGGWYHILLNAHGRYFVVDDEFARSIDCRWPQPIRTSPVGSGPIGHRKTSRQAGQPWQHTMDDRQGVMHAGPFLKKVASGKYLAEAALARRLFSAAAMHHGARQEIRIHKCTTGSVAGLFSSTIDPSPGYMSEFRERRNRGRRPIPWGSSSCCQSTEASAMGIGKCGNLFLISFINHARNARETRHGVLDGMWESHDTDAIKGEHGASFYPLTPV